MSHLTTRPTVAIMVAFAATIATLFIAAMLASPEAVVEFISPYRVGALGDHLSDIDPFGGTPA